jgi:hypothetical protein
MLLLLVLFADTSVAGGHLDAREYIVPAGRAASFYDRPWKTKFWTPSPLDIERMRPKLVAFVKSQKDPNWGDQRSLPELSSFARQYVGVVIGGRKLIWTNAFATFVLTDGNRIDQPMEVDDGGCGFWRVYFDVASGKLNDFGCNAV